jgi:hypothetical protein
MGNKHFKSPPSEFPVELRNILWEDDPLKEKPMDIDLETNHPKEVLGNLVNASRMILMLPNRLSTHQE